MPVKDVKPHLVTGEAVPAADQPPYELSVQYQVEQTLLFLALLIGIFYFLLIRPQQKQQKEHNAKLSTLKKGSRIITSGGVHGAVTKLEGDIVHVEIAPNVRVKLQKYAIADVLEEGKATASTANDN